MALTDMIDKATSLDPSERPVVNIDKCVQCSSCVALCPTYMEDAMEGMNARGRVTLLNKFTSGELRPSSVLDQRIFSCLLCGACNTLCPCGINITDAIYEGRERLRGHNKKRELFGYGMRFVLKRAPLIFKWLKIYQELKEILPVHKLRHFRVLKEMGLNLPHSSLREGSSIFRVPNPKGRVAIFAGCTINFLYPTMGKALIRKLNTSGYDVILPKGEVCCGAPFLGLGLKEDAAEMMEKNIMTFQNLNVEAVISLCPTCGSFLTRESQRLIGGGISNMMDISQFIGQVVSMPRDKGQTAQSGGKKDSGVTRTPGAVIYHDPCHSLYHLGVSKEPRQILTAMGFNLIEPKERGCCGFGGTFKLFYQGLSQGILQKRAEDYKEADMIVTSCPNCVLQFKSMIKDKPIKHIIEVLEENNSSSKSKK